MSLSLPLIAVAASVAGTAVSALGAISSGNAAAAQSRYQSQVASNNAAIAEQNAQYAARAGEAKAQDQGLRERAVRGATLAALASSGVDVNTGSAADVREGVARTGETDIARVRQDAALREYGYRSQSTNFLAEAGLDKAAATNDQAASLYKAGGTLLAGAGALGDPSDKWAALKGLGGGSSGGNPYFAYGST